MAVPPPLPSLYFCNNPRSYIVGGDDGLRVPCPDMLHARRIVPVSQLLETDLAQRARITRAEMIAVVLYTGPMFVVCVPC